MATGKTMFYLILAGLCAGLFIFPDGVVLAGEDSQPVRNLRIPPEGQVQLLTLKDGSMLIGKVTAIGENAVTFQTELGELEIRVASIDKIREVQASRIRNGKYWFPNPNATRLFLGPTARTLKKGEGYFADHELFFPAVTVGLSDRITIGGGMSIFPGVGLDRQLFFLTPKVGFEPVGKLHFAAGALLLKIPDLSRLVGMPYGLGTYGTPDGSISIGLGYGFVGRHFAEKPLVMLGGEKRLSRRIAIVSENWVVPGGDAPVVAYGIRLMGEGLCVDLAFFNILNDNAVFPGIPYLDLVFKF